MIIERSISLGDTLQLIIEVDDDFSQRQHEVELYTVSTHIFLVDEFASFIQTEFHDRSNKIGSRNDGCPDIWFLNMINQSWVWQSGRIVNLFLTALLVVYHIRYVRYGSDDIHIKLTVQSLLYDFHVEQTEESASETEAQSHRTLWRESQ